MSNHVSDFALYEQQPKPTQGHTMFNTRHRRFSSGNNDFRFQRMEETQDIHQGNQRRKTISDYHKSYLMVILTIAIIVLASTLGAQPAWDIVYPFPTAGDVVKISFPTEQHGFLLTGGGVAVATNDYGASWHRLPLPENCEGFLDIQFFDQYIGWALAKADNINPWLQTLYFTENSGADWVVVSVGSEQQPAGFTDLHFRTALRGWVYGGTSVNGSTHPVVVSIVNNEPADPVILPSGSGVRILDISFLDNSQGIAVGEDGYVAYTVNGGNDWVAVERQTDYDLNVALVTHRVSLVGGGNFNHAVLLSSANLGEDWSLNEAHNLTSKIVGINSSAGSDLYSVLSSGWNNAPAQIQVANGNNLDLWDTVYESDQWQVFNCQADNGMIGGVNGLLVDVDAQNRSSRQITRYLIDGAIHSTFFLNDRHGWLCGEDGKLFKTINGGGYWTEIQNDWEYDMLNVFFLSESEGIVTGRQRSNYITSDGGEHWESINIGDADVNLLTFTDGVGYATHGTMVSVSREDIHDWEATDVIQGQLIPAIGLSVPTADIAYVASAGDSLRRTIDRGNSWQAVEAPFLRCFGVSFIDPANGWAMGATAQGIIRLFFTEDSGANWASGARFDFTPGGVHFFDEFYGWVWENPGHIYTTENGGQTWSDMNLRVERIIRRIHVDRPNRFWLVGDGGLVARWGENWLSVPSEQESVPQVFNTIPAYPNPTNGTVNFVISDKQIRNLEVYDLSGRLVFSKLFSSNGVSQSTIQIDISDFATGYYSAHFQFSGRTEISSFVVIK